VAFTTQEGTGGAPWTFLGTPENDSIAVITGDLRDTVAFDFIAEGFEGDDTINFNGTRSVTIKGGQGADLITNNVAASAALTSLISNSFINGNDGDDAIGNSQVGLLATLSTISGGQGEDEIFIGSLQSAKVNGNRGADFLEIGDLDQGELIAGQFNNFNSASIFGGQGDDLFEVTTDVRQITNSLVSGQIGNDLMALSIGVFDFGAAIGQTIPGFSDPLTFPVELTFNPDAGVESDPSTRGTVFSGGDGDDVIDASGILLFDDVTEASASDLKIVGDAGDDSIFGGAGEDEIAGNDGADWLAGYGGRDLIEGGKGDDLLIGAYYDGEINIPGVVEGVGFIGDGAGDVLSGGTGSNRFFVPGSQSSFGFGGQFANGLGSTFKAVLNFDTFEAGTSIAGTISDGDEFLIPFGADVITDWNSGTDNVLDTGLADTLAVGGAIQDMSLFSDYNGEVPDNFAVRGFYKENFGELGQFIVSQFGSDIAVWTNYSGEDVYLPVTDDEGFQISGYSDVDNFTVLKDVPFTTTLTPNEFVAVG